jgi:ribose-phosphate pyrophosphokinase
MADDLVIFSGNANRCLAETIARALGRALGSATVERFPDGEVDVRLHGSVRQRAVVLIQSTAPPVNDHLMELLALADASRRASAARVIAVVPYFGYARSDKRHGDRTPIAARLVADLLQTAGVDHVITVDLHASQIEGFFRIPVDSLSAVPVITAAVRPYLPAGTVVVSPDAGRLSMATEYAAHLDTSLVLVHKTRESGTRTRVTHLVGDVRDRPCLIVDDMISTGGTIEETLEALQQAGAAPGIRIAATHGLLLKQAPPRLSADTVADVFVTDTVRTAVEPWPRLHVISIASLVADAIRRVTGSAGVVNRES